MASSPPREVPSSSIESTGGGWSIELVNPSRDTQCPICLLVLKDPHLTDCGHHFCHGCIERVMNSSSGCPLCKKTGFAIFPNLDKKREILSKEVYCINKRHGCPWRGQFGSLYEGHLNNGECSYMKRPCRYNCGQHFRPQELALHESQCPKMPLEHVVHVLREEQSHIVGVVNSLMKQINSLKEDNKSLKETNRTLRSELESMNERHYIEMTNLLESHQVQLATGRGKSDQMSREIDRLVKRVDDIALNVQVVQENRAGIVQIMPFMDKMSQWTSELEQLRLTSTSAPPIILILHGFNDLRAKGIWWQSRPFYSHPGGYKFRLEVKPAGTGSGAGVHVSVYVHVMRGEYDDVLRWPLSAFVHFRLLDSLPGQNHYENKVFFSRDNEASQRVKEENKDTGTGRGYAQFILLTQLETVNAKFLSNDSLTFEITKVIFK